MDDLTWMKMALEWAIRGKGWVEPNPMVGCVAVANGKMIAAGYHHVFGGPHAEVDALQHLDASQLAEATVYVTLEPCSHTGKTPPCAPMLAAKKPKRVVVAMTDPFPKVAGRGIEHLRNCGIDVTVGVGEELAKELNAPYLKRINQHRPWLIAKWAMTLDGAIATSTGDSKWISGEASRAEVHRMRGELDGIVIGIGSVLADDPLLTARTSAPARTPRRIVLDRKARLPLDSQLIKTIEQAPVWVISSQSAPRERLAQLEAHGVKICIAEDESGTLEHALEQLNADGCTNVMLEGGSALLGSAFERDLVDQIECFIAPKIVGNGLPPVAGAGVARMELASRWRCIQTVPRNEDVHLTLRKRVSEN